MGIPSSDPDHRQTGTLLLLFLTSGCSALMYEIVWFQQFSLVLGSSAVSMAILLASFMGGLCFGNLAFGRLIPHRHHSLRVYALLELLIAICGIGSLWIFPLVSQVYCDLLLTGPRDLVARGVMATALMLVPTALMGGTLPAIARSVPATRSGMAWLGWFYAANTFGGMIGSLLAGMWLLRLYDVSVATWVAVTMNLGIALAAYRLAQGKTDGKSTSAFGSPGGSQFLLPLHKTEIFFGDRLMGKTLFRSEVVSQLNLPGAQDRARRPVSTEKFAGEKNRCVKTSQRFGVVHLAIGLSGLTAMGAEVVWNRYLGLLLGPTVYTFSLILAVFLFGLGIGSSVGSWLGRNVRRPRLALAVTQLLLVVAIPYAATMIVSVVPDWLVLRGNNELFTVRMTRDLIRTLATLLPATCLWGASFPLSVAALSPRVARSVANDLQVSEVKDRLISIRSTMKFWNRPAADDGQGEAEATEIADPSCLIGSLSAANAIGAIAGALGVGLWAMPAGGQFVQQMLTALCGLSSLLMFSSLMWSQVANSMKSVFASSRRSRIAFCLLSAAVLILPWQMVPAVPIGMLAESRCSRLWTGAFTCAYAAEGLDSPIVVSDWKDGTRCFHVAGKIEASTRERDLRTQHLLGHLPALAHVSPRKVLVIGCGSGMTAGSLLLHSSIKEIVVCEMERCVIDAARDHFAAYNNDVLRDPRTRIVHDDARHFLATTREKFDLITADPIHPWVKGAAALYTAEFFQLCKSHLNANGIMTSWVPLYESNEAAVKCELATFIQEFPFSTIWNGQGLHVGYDLVIVGSLLDQPIDLSQMSAKISTSSRLSDAFDDIGLSQANPLSDHFLAEGNELRTWLHGAQINRDRNLRLQYLAGMNPDYDQQQQIFQSMMAACRHGRDETVPVLTVTAE